ncbi:hypothetical protein ACFSM5_11160 [Lacibacterium aquatile]|uniref:Uncharacterized protein n=1 Tax=Lacibacterium aquatile TaxID=1168082 RepID=A0ABW5DS63_9PROT
MSKPKEDAAKTALAEVDQLIDEIREGRVKLKSKQTIGRILQAIKVVRGQERN